MSNLAKLALKNDDGLFRVVIETPRGETRKIDYDDKDRCFFVKRRLPLGLAYPFHFGFLPSTLGDDGDPLDAVLLCFDDSVPGLVVTSRIVGVLKVEQRNGKGKTKRNDRFIAVPGDDVEHQDVTKISDVTPDRRKQIEQFLADSVKLEKKRLQFLGWGGADEAADLIRAGAAKVSRTAKKKKG